jgi:hypothetical protein
MAKRAETPRSKAVLETGTAPPPPPPPPVRSTRVERERARRDKKRQARLIPVSARRPMERRYRQTIRSVDLWTVLKISVCFYLCGLIVTLASGIVLWWIATGLGVIHNIERFIGDLLGSNDFQFLSWRLLRGAVLIGLVIVCVQVVCTVLAAAFYNLFAELLGGIEIVVVEEEPAA